MPPRNDSLPRIITRLESQGKKKRMGKRESLEQQTIRVLLKLDAEADNERARAYLLTAQLAEHENATKAAFRTLKTVLFLETFALSVVIGMLAYMLS